MATSQIKANTQRDQSQYSALFTPAGGKGLQQLLLEGCQLHFQGRLLSRVIGMCFVVHSQLCA
jgi:hypothetical protein